MLAITAETLRMDAAIAVEETFDFQSEEYRAFFNLHRGTVFQAPVWMDLIHRRLATNLSAKQHTITVRDPRDGALLVVIPMVIQQAARVQVLQPADFGVCDYNCAVGDRVVLETLAADPAAVSGLDALLSGAHVLLFRKVRDDGFDPARLFSRTTATPCENAAFHSDVGDDFDAWQRRTIRRKFSKELGRLARQLEREAGLYEHRAATTEAEVREAFAFLRSVRDGRFEADLLQRDVYWNFYLAFAIAGLTCGECVTYVSYLGGKPVAVLFGLAGGDQFHAVLSGFDADGYGKYSVGLQIIYRIIKLRFEQGFKRFDMGLGNTGYKSNFRVEETQLHNFSRSTSFSGSAFAFVYHRLKSLKNALKRCVPQFR
ncbi:GNAT family N-acetyltransferase [Afipia sp. P52-10]|uniref:GNAT family N-acetyltransferase n=1 Tax=Afipia sp. P52-10 TaxID=1429916 RepID=UPI0004B0BAD6|nr:GNAT family N-acetyltransferase [Afipia sp. P52-10]